MEPRICPKIRKGAAVLVWLTQEEGGGDGSWWGCYDTVHPAGTGEEQSRAVTRLGQVRSAAVSPSGGADAASPGVAVRVSEPGRRAGLIRSRCPLLPAAVSAPAEREGAAILAVRTQPGHPGLLPPAPALRALRHRSCRDGLTARSASYAFQVIFLCISGENIISPPCQMKNDSYVCKQAAIIYIFLVPTV